MIDDPLAGPWQPDASSSPEALAWFFGSFFPSKELPPPFDGNFLFSDTPTLKMESG